MEWRLEELQNVIGFSSEGELLLRDRSMDGHLVAIDPDGKVLRSVRVGGALWAATQVAPERASDLLCMFSTGGLSNHQAHLRRTSWDGTVVWEHRIGEHGSPNHVVLSAGTDGSVRAVVAFGEKRALVWFDVDGTQRQLLPPLPVQAWPALCEPVEVRPGDYVLPIRLEGGDLIVLEFAADRDPVQRRISLGDSLAGFTSVPFGAVARSVRSDRGTHAELVLFGRRGENEGTAHARIDLRDGAVTWGEPVTESFRGARSLSWVGRPDLVLAFYDLGSYQVIGDSVAYHVERQPKVGGVPILGLLAGQPVVSISYHTEQKELYRLIGLER